MMLKADDMGATDGGTQNTTRSVQNHQGIIVGLLARGKAVKAVTVGSHPLH